MRQRTPPKKRRSARIGWPWVRRLIVSGLFGTALVLSLHGVMALWHPHPVSINDTDDYSSTPYQNGERKTAVITGSRLPIADPLSLMSESTINNTVNVVRDFGARADGVTDDTAAIQRAINRLYRRGGGTIVFPPGTYRVTSVTLKENIIYRGYGATIKRPARQGKWTRTFTTNYASNIDSRPLMIQGFTFDGNQEQQGAYRDYELEQAHLLFLMANPKFSGRLKVTVEDCVFKNSVADGISVYTNVDIRVNNCEAIDVFRGGFVLTGGNSKAEVTNLTTRGARNPTGIDIEVDGKGYGDTLKTEIKLENIRLINGDFDIAVSGGSTVIGNRIFSDAPFYLYSLNSTMRFTHSQFKVGAADSHVNRIVFPYRVTFEDCEFIVTRQTTANLYRFYAAADVWWQHPGQPNQRNQQLVFRDCSFKIDNTIRPTDLTYAIYLRSDFPLNNNRLAIERGNISNQFSAQIMREVL